MRVDQLSLIASNLVVDQQKVFELQSSGVDRFRPLLAVPGGERFEDRHLHSMFGTMMIMMMKLMMMMVMVMVTITKIIAIMMVAMMMITTTTTPIIIIITTTMW